MTQRADAKSLAVTIYNAAGEVLFHVGVPLSGAAPAINRILRQVPSETAIRLKEPWYFLLPHRPGDASVFQRSLLPEGFCSLYGDRYEPDLEPPPRVLHRPKPLVEFFTVI